jgi:hypothetical protein
VSSSVSFKVNLDSLGLVDQVIVTSFGCSAEKQCSSVNITIAEASVTFSKRSLSINLHSDLTLRNYQLDSRDSSCMFSNKTWKVA